MPVSTRFSSYVLCIFGINCNRRNFLFTDDQAVERLETLQVEKFSFTDNENGLQKSEAMVKELERRAHSPKSNEEKMQVDVFSVSEDEQSGHGRSNI